MRVAALRLWIAVATVVAVIGGGVVGGLVAIGPSRATESLGLPMERAVAVDVSRLATPAELVHALELPGAALDQLLGARRVEAHSSIKLEPPGRPAEKLDESYRVDSDGKGAVHLIHDNARDGLEVIATGGQLYVRPRYGHFTRRRAEHEDVARLRDNVEGVAGAYLELLQRWLVVKEIGRTQVGGRTAVRLSLAATASPSSGSAQSLPYRKWRDTIKVGYVNGEWLLDAASGAPIQGKLEASYTFERSDLKGPVAVTLQWEQHGGAPEAIQAPADAVEPRRPRPLLDRDILMEGLPLRPGH
jgi:hypothetical protein